MTIDKAKLKELAQAVAELEDIPERQDEHAEAVAYLETHMHCHTILALIAEIERIELVSRLSCNHDAYMAVLAERDQLKAENEALRSALRAFTGARYPVSLQIDMRGHRWSEPYLDEAMELAKRAMAKEVSQ